MGIEEFAEEFLKAHDEAVSSGDFSKLETLEEKGLIITKREGKLRTIYITEKGKTLLHKRQKAWFSHFIKIDDLIRF